MDCWKVSRSPKWNGPALPRPEGHAGLEEIIDTVDKLIARGEYLIQAKDALSIEYTLRGITATAKRFMLGTEDEVQQAALLRVLLTYVESFLSRVFSDTSHADRIASAFTELRAKLESRVARPLRKSPEEAPVQATAPPADDYSTFTLENPEQFSMAWTTFQDLFRHGSPHVDKYVAALTHPEDATRRGEPLRHRHDRLLRPGA